MPTLEEELAEMEQLAKETERRSEERLKEANREVDEALAEFRDQQTNIGNALSTPPAGGLDEEAAEQELEELSALRPEVSRQVEGLQLITKLNVDIIKQYREVRERAQNEGREDLLKRIDKGESEATKRAKGAIRWRMTLERENKTLEEFPEIRREPKLMEQAAKIGGEMRRRLTERYAQAPEPPASGRAPGRARGGAGRSR